MWWLGLACAAGRRRSLGPAAVSVLGVADGRLAQQRETSPVVVLSQWSRGSPHLEMVHCSRLTVEQEVSANGDLEVMFQLTVCPSNGKQITNSI